MTARTRYFVIASLLVLGVGLGTGMVAYYVGFPAGAFARGLTGPDELRLVPNDATLIAYADVRDVMASDLRQKLHKALPVPPDGQREFEERTGINIETDIDHIVACLHPDRGEGLPGAGMVLARGRFNEVKIEALMREHGAQVENYRGKRLIVANAAPYFGPGSPAGPGSPGNIDPDDQKPPASHSLSLAFLEPGLVSLGSTKLIRAAIDLHQTGDNPQAGLQSVTGNDQMMTLVKSLESGNAWAVGRFDALQAQARLPQELSSRLPPISWFAVSGHVNGGLSAVIRAEARDDESAANLRDVVRGFMALAKMQAGSRPEFQALMQSLELSGTGKTVALSFAVPSQVFDAIGAIANEHKKRLEQ